MNQVETLHEQVRTQATNTSALALTLYYDSGLIMPKIQRSSRWRVYRFRQARCQLCSPRRTSPSYDERQEILSAGLERAPWQC
jgi:hypothetical protein